ncbi:LADA_0A06612g1_1 [Lachancea dasiensis]|uniref:LADA_0A06612g1_1 n=1 Tax=Lachancea dasiensis TaxID=1072105 RepID=A0A1G4IQ52_9SACH|nr:LADA_0A06612g1_1 [Lachancea dasiensis]
MNDFSTPSSSTTLRKRESNDIGPALTAEERVFGPRNDSQLSACRSTERSSLGVLLSALAVVITSALMFLLGVNIVIQYRTMVTDDRSGLVRKATYILLSGFAIFLLNKFNLWFYRKMLSHFSGAKYQRVADENGFEMMTRRA